MKHNANRLRHPRHSRHPRQPVRLRDSQDHPADRRLLLGRELWPNLPHPQAAGCRGADCREGFRFGSRVRQEYSHHPGWTQCLGVACRALSRRPATRRVPAQAVLWQAGRAQQSRVAHIRAFQQKARGFLDSILILEKLAQAHNAHQPGFPYWMLTLSYGVGQLRAALAWGETALATLNAAEAVAVPVPPSPKDQSLVNLP